MKKTACFSVGRIVLALLLAPGAFAAGGHHGTDDAAILDAGVCEVEGWTTRNRGAARALHAGTGCRVGPVEVSLGWDRVREGDTTSRSFGLAIKWAHDVSEALSLGLSAAPGWQNGANPSYQATAITGLATWQAAETVRLHANLGRNMAHRAKNETRSGVSADWSFQSNWQVMTERYRADGGYFARTGLRWMPAQGWAVDASKAHHHRGTGVSGPTLGWTLGLTREFD